MLRWLTVLACLLGLVGETIGLAAWHVGHDHGAGEEMACHGMDEAEEADSAEEPSEESAAIMPPHECCETQCTHCACCTRLPTPPAAQRGPTVGDAPLPVYVTLDLSAYRSTTFHDVILGTLDRPPKHA